MRTFPHPGIPAALAVWICFTAPVLAGAGLGACAVFWIALSAGYLRRGELAIIAVDCSSPSASCFCGSLGTGPELQRPIADPLPVDLHAALLDVAHG